MTVTLPHERKYILSRENVKIAHEIADALVANNQEKIDELAKKLILPLSKLKFHVKNLVLENGLPTITTEVANHTD